MAYGNCRVYPARVTDLGDYWRITACFIDYETGAELARDFQQRKSGSRMGDDAERNLDMAFQIGESKALRNVVVNALQPLADFALGEARNALVDKIGNELERYRRLTIERVSAHVSLDRVEAVIGRAAKDWLAPDIARVISIATAVTDGMASWNDSFPPLRKEEAGQAALDQFARSAPDNRRRPADDPGAEAAAGVPDTPAPAAAPDTAERAARREAVDKMLILSADPHVELQDRLANLDGLMPAWEDRLGNPAFTKVLFDTCVKVARGELKIGAARRYLINLP